MKKDLLIPLLCLALVLPVCTAGAQEEEQEAAQETTPVTVQEKAQDTTPRTTQGTQGADTISGWINKIIGYVSQIGNLFGKTLGFRIGGTTSTAIAALAIAKLAENKLPSLLKWALYLTGGTMIAGSGANITQTIMKALGL